MEDKYNIPQMFFVSDPTRPYEEEIAEDMTYIWAHVPRKTVIERTGGTGRTTATAFGAESPYSKLALDFIVSLSKVCNGIEGPIASHMQTKALDLLSAALSAQPQATSSRRIPPPISGFDLHNSNVQRRLLTNISPTQTSRLTGSLRR